MARRKQTVRPIAKRRLTTSQIIFYILSLIIILSMAIGFVISVAIPQTDQGAGATSVPAPLSEPVGAPTLSIGETPASGQATAQPGQ